MNLYTEKATSLIYEVQLFEDYALVKQATPGEENNLRQISLEEFGRDFDEFWGDPQQVFDFLRDGLPPVEIN